MSERDDLARNHLANIIDGVFIGNGQHPRYSEQIADAILAAGWVPAERLTRVERFHMGVRIEVEKVLDGALGTEEKDGAGEGLASDVQLLASQRDALATERDEWKARWEGYRLMYRERFNAGLSDATWHREHCAAVPAIERVRALVGDWQANGGSCGLGDPTADVWHKCARQLLAALDGDPS